MARIGRVPPSKRPLAVGSEPSSGAGYLGYYRVSQDHLLSSYITFASNLDKMVDEGRRPAPDCSNLLLERVLLHLCKEGLISGKAFKPNRASSVKAASRDRRIGLLAPANGCFSLIPRNSGAPHF
jgi:hypothetical protein